MMSAVRAMYLHAEHHNEAMLRVSLEIVTCPEASKCLQWDDEWFSNDVQREAFRSAIHEKINVVRLGSAAQVKKSSEDGDGAAQVDKMSSGQPGDDMQKARDECQAAQEETADCKARIAELEAQVLRLRTSLRANMRDTFMADARKGRQASDNFEGGSRGWKDGAQDWGKRHLSDCLEESTKMGESHGKKNFCDAEAQCLVEEVNAAVDAGVVELLCSECRETSRNLQLCKAQLALADPANSSAETLELVNRKSPASEKTAKGNKKNRMLVTGDEDATTADAASWAAGEPSWADKSSELERAKRKLAQRDLEISELKARMHGMSRALFQLKESLHKLREIAEARGFGRLVDEAMEESKVVQILDDPEYPIWNRLYQDALRRQEKAKLRDQKILGSSSSSPGLLAAVRPPSRLQAGGQAERQGDSSAVIQSRPGTPAGLKEGGLEVRANFLNAVDAPRAQPAMSAMMLDLQLPEGKTISSSSPLDQILQPHVDEPFSEKFVVEHRFQQPSSEKGLEQRVSRSFSTPILKSQGKRMLERKGLPGVRSGLPCLLGGPNAQSKMIPEQLKASRRHWPSKETVDFQHSKPLSVDWLTEMAPLCGRAPLVTVSFCSDSESRR